MEGKKLYVGNINYLATNKQMFDLFSQYGEVKNVNIIPGKGFGFVEFRSAQDAQKAIEAINGTHFMNRNLRVAVAHSSDEIDKG